MSIWGRIVSVLAFLVIASPVGAGDLTPPGAPAPSMKTLDEVEPRIPVGPLTTPGDADSVYRLNQPGSYYLTGNVQGEVGKHGIEVLGRDITLDLMGFSVIGVTGSLNGIQMNFDGTSSSNIRLRNGTIRDFDGAGVNVGSAAAIPGRFERLAAINNGGIGIMAFIASAVDCVAVSNGSHGIYLGRYSVATRCSSNNNGGSGFVVEGSTILSDCVANANSGIGFGVIGGFGGQIFRNCIADFNDGHGFNLRSGTVVEGCVAIGMPASGQVAAGFRTTGDSNVFTDCVARDNTGAGFDLSSGATLTGCSATTSAGPGFLLGANARADACAATANVGEGFVLADGGTITNSSSTDNAGDGVVLANHCTATGNTVVGNGASAAIAGFRVDGDLNRLEGNRVGDNGRSYIFIGTRNIAVRNLGGGNMAAADLGLGNFFPGPAANPATAGPWDNLSH
ncbi:MAG: right-handed parallel beta-helix repeat-containing protein [Phycisphaerales bacterium]